MKGLKITFVVLCMLIAAVAGSVFAQVDVADVTLGSASQDRDEAVSKTFTIRNTFNESITINSISTSADAAYALSVSGVTLPQVLASGASVTATLNGFVPLSHDSVDASFDESAIVIGSVNVGFTQASGPTGTASNSVLMQAENGLEISDADIEITGEAERTSGIDDGDDFDVKPGDQIRIEIAVENTFSSSVDTDIDDIRVFIDIEDDSDFDIDDDAETIDLDAGDDDIIVFLVDIDEEADDGSHTVTVTVEGTDENGAQHGEVLEFEINIDRERHDVRIERLTVSPERVSCSLTAADVIEVEVRMINRGQDDEREAAIEVSAPTLGSFRERAEDIDLDQDESATRRFIIPLPENVNGGSHRITARTFFSNTVAQDVEEVVVSVEACEAEEPTTPPPSSTPQPPVVTSPPVVTQPTTGSGTVSATPTSSGFAGSTAYVIVLVALIVMVGGAVLGLGAYLLLRK